MSKTDLANANPTLPQYDSAEDLKQRNFDLCLARTSYNYMRSYLEPIPLSADVPHGEEFSIPYQAKVLETFLPLVGNFKDVVLELLERELRDDLPIDLLADIQDSFNRLQAEMSFNISQDLANIEELLKSLSQLPQDIERAIRGATELPGDLQRMLTGLEKVFCEFLQSGVTAFLKSTMFDMLRHDHGGDYLQAQTVEDYELLFKTLPLPFMLNLERKAWMPKDERVCEQDWYFGYLQVAGYNTTILKGVRLDRTDGDQVVTLAELLKKIPLTDRIFQDVIKNSGVTLAEAAQQKRLFVCDYGMLANAQSEPLHGEQRYLAAPIAIFYWNTAVPEGYPPGSGVMQPIAIQLGQQFNDDSTPIFTPNNCSDANDENGLKWKIAKYIVNVMCAVQHESVAHFGACHLTMEPVVVAARRQLSIRHPLLQLLIPHFRFTIQINDDALHSLIIPGGVVATTIAPTIESTRQLIVEAAATWRWDEQCPEHLFKARGVDQDALPKFPFRDDTMLLWHAIKTFVASYVDVYYENDNALLKDTELQGWINELTSPLYAGLKGMNGLRQTGDSRAPYRIDNKAYLVQVIAHIIYLAGPQHAAVNYAQYPLMSYTPAVAGSFYKEPPSRGIDIATQQDCLAWFPPLDIALYTVSFEYLLSGIQFDTFGHYNANPRLPYFKDSRVNDAVLDFQEALARIEAAIRKENKARPMPYPFQLPSLIPNSISI